VNGRSDVVTGFRLSLAGAISAFTHVFDTLWPGSLGRNDGCRGRAIAARRGYMR
jgi:hypothetical protein